MRFLIFVFIHNTVVNRVLKIPYSQRIFLSSIKSCVPVLASRTAFGPLKIYVYIRFFENDKTVELFLIS